MCCCPPAATIGAVGKLCVWSPLESCEMRLSGDPPVFHLHRNTFTDWIVFPRRSAAPAFSPNPALAAYIQFLS